MTDSAAPPPGAAGGGHARATLAMAVTLASLSMFGPFAIDSIFPGFAAIQRQFEVSTAAMQQITSVYLLSFAVMSLVHGPLSDALGRKPVMIGGVVIFVIASLGCAFAPNLPVLLGFRALQGMSAGAGSTVGRAVVTDLFEGHEAKRLMSQIAMIFSVSPALAPIVGGEILRFATWPAIFVFTALFAVAALAAVLVVVPESHPAPNRRPLRLGAMVRGMAHVARDPVFARLAVMTPLLFASQFLYIASAPIFVVDLLGRGSQDFWIFFVPMVTGMILGSWVTGRLSRTWSFDRLVWAGIVMAWAGVSLNVLFAVLPATRAALPWAIIGPSVCAFGVSLVFPMLNLEMVRLFPTHRGSAASLSTFGPLVLNAVLAGVVAPLVATTVLRLGLASMAFVAAATALWVAHLALSRRAIGHR